MAKFNTAEKLTVLIFAGTKGCENYSDVCSHYSMLNMEKPESLYEIAVDRSKAVHKLSLPPDRKIFIASPAAKPGGELTPSTTVEVFEYNGRKWDRLIGNILEQARKLRAKEINVTFLLTLVGGTGFTFALNFSRLLRAKIAGRMTNSTCFVATAPPLSMIERPSKFQDALKNANTLFALKHTVADSDNIDLAYIRFPYQLTASDRRIGFLLQGLGILPVENSAQANPFQQEQLIGVAREKRYNLIVEADQIIRFPKQQIQQREIAASQLTKARTDLSMLEVEFQKIENLKPSKSTIEEEVNSLSERIVRVKSVRSTRWRKILAEAESNAKNAKEHLVHGSNVAMKTEETVKNLAELRQSISLQAQKIDALIAQLDEELAMGHFKDGVMLLRVLPEEREKLSTFADLDKMSLKTIMTKLNREKELYDLIQGEIEKPVGEIFLQYHGIRFPENVLQMDNTKIVVSSSENTEHLELQEDTDTHLVNDASLRDEILIIALCMTELETFDFIHRMQDAIESFDIPIPKRLSLPGNNGLEQTILKTKLRSQTRSAIMKDLMEALSFEQNQDSKA